MLIFAKRWVFSLFFIVSSAYLWCPVFEGPFSVSFWSRLVTQEGAALWRSTDCTKNPSSRFGYEHWCIVLCKRISEEKRLDESSLGTTEKIPTPIVSPDSIRRDELYFILSRIFLQARLSFELVSAHLISLWWTPIFIFIIIIIILLFFSSASKDQK